MNIDWSLSHCGLMLCSFEQTEKLMPEVTDILSSLKPKLELEPNDYYIDVKVHMLLPNQYPCIPNWHCDFVPRDKDGKKLYEKRTREKMYLWVSNPPLTRFKDEETGVIKDIKEKTWVEFTQFDLHKAVKAESSCWRCFIRVIPRNFIHRNTLNIGKIRRHSQVYLTENFTW